MSARIYCGRLPSNATEKDLESLLKSIGKVRDIEFKEGYAYAVFKEPRDAEKAVTQLNGTPFMGESILVERAKDTRNGVGGYTVAGGYTSRVRQPKPPPVRTNHRIRVENLPTRAKWSELKEFMSVAGDVTFADTHRRRPGEGVVEFATKDDMMRALETLDKHEFLGRKIKLIKESPRSGKDHSQSRSRSPSPPKKRRKYSSSRSPSRDKSESPERSRKRHSLSESPSRSRGRSRRSRSESNHKSSSRSHKRRSRSKSPKRSHHKSRSWSRSKEISKSQRHSSSSGRSHKKKKKHKSRSRSKSKSPKRHRS